MPHNNKPNSAAIALDIKRHVGHFEEDPYLRLGEADSAHGVVFGEFKGVGQVAVKRFSKAGTALRENNRLIKIRERGIEAIEPQSVATGALGTYLITHRYGGLRHMGQLDWRVNVAALDTRKK